MVLGIAGAIALGAPAQAYAADVTLKLTTCLVRNHDQVVAMFKTFVDPLNAKNAGIKINYLGGPEVTPFNKQAAALQRGLVDMISCPAAYYAGQVTAARMIGVNTVPPAEIRKNGAWDTLQQLWGKKINARILGWGHWEAGTYYVYTVKPPKQSEKTGLDLSGLKMRSTGLYSAFLKAMGATPITIAPGDVYASLERGLSDGLAWPEGAVATYGWQRFLKYRIKPGYFNSTTLVLINVNAYNKLSKAQRELLDSQGLAYEKDSNAVLTKLSAADNEKLAKAGLQDVELNGAVRAAYLKTIYRAKWAENDAVKHDFDYQALKAKMYKEPGS
jgi:TRAP-type C4-dicarboxylate transport system substrate-binding protein